MITKLFLLFIWGSDCRIVDLKVILNKYRTAVNILYFSQNIQDLMYFQHVGPARTSWTRGIEALDYGREKRE